MKSIGAQVLSYILNGHHEENPLPSRVVESLALDGLITNEKPLTSPEGRSLMRIYPKRMRLTEKGKSEYLAWLRARKNVFSYDLRKLEKMTSWKS